MLSPIGWAPFSEELSSRRSLAPSPDSELVRGDSRVALDEIGGEPMKPVFREKNMELGKWCGNHTVRQDQVVNGLIQISLGNVNTESTSES